MGRGGGELVLCRNGIHACRPEALPRWLGEELWLAELEDVEQDDDGLLLARRGRLVERIEAWNGETSRELARSAPPSSGSSRPRTLTTSCSSVARR